MFKKIAPRVEVPTLYVQKICSKIAPRVEVPTLYVWQCTTWEFNVFPVDGCSDSGSAVDGRDVIITNQIGEETVADDRHCGKAAGGSGLQFTLAVETLAAMFLNASLGYGCSNLVGDVIRGVVPSKQKEVVFEGSLGGRI